MCINLLYKARRCAGLSELSVVRFHSDTCYNKSDVWKEAPAIKYQSSHPISPFHDCHIRDAWLSNTCFPPFLDFLSVLFSDGLMSPPFIYPAIFSMYIVQQAPS